MEQLRVVVHGEEHVLHAHNVDNVLGQAGIEGVSHQLGRENVSKQLVELCLPGQGLVKVHLVPGGAQLVKILFQVRELGVEVAAQVLAGGA